MRQDDDQAATEVEHERRHAGAYFGTLVVLILITAVWWAITGIPRFGK